LRRAIVGVIGSTILVAGILMLVQLAFGYFTA
jgi:hypothetical protein